MCDIFKSAALGDLTDISGAFFGTTFAPLFFQTYPELLSAPFAPSSSTSSTPIAPSASGLDSRGPSPSPSPSLSYSLSLRPGGETYTNPDPHGGQKAALGKVYAPRIYGFKVSERARSGPRMRWLRERPERWEELDNVDHRGRWKEGEAGLGLGFEGDEAGQTQAQAGSGTAAKDKEKGRLFDDDDEKEGEDEEEEEEEEVAPPQQQQPGRQAGQIATVLPPAKQDMPQPAVAARGGAGGGAGRGQAKGRGGPRGSIGSPRP